MTITSHSLTQHAEIGAFDQRVIAYLAKMLPMMHAQEEEPRVISACVYTSTILISVSSS
jgi:hypothetical protein